MLLNSSQNMERYSPFTISVIQYGTETSFIRFSLDQQYSTRLYDNNHYIRQVSMLLQFTNIKLVKLVERLEYVSTFSSGEPNFGPIFRKSISPKFSYQSFSTTQEPNNLPFQSIPKVSNGLGYPPQNIGLQLQLALTEFLLPLP